MITQRLQERLKQLYDELIRKGNLCRGTYKADSFPYVAISSSDAPSGIIKKYGAAFGFTYATQDETTMMGIEAMFGHCEKYLAICNERKRKMFVISDIVPEEFRNPCAAHLYIHGYYEFTEKKAARAYATRAEFEEAASKGTDFLKRYTAWWITQLKSRLDTASPRALSALKKLLPPASVKVLRQNGYAL